LIDLRGGIVISPHTTTSRTVDTVSGGGDILTSIFMLEHVLFITIAHLISLVELLGQQRKCLTATLVCCDK